MTWKKLRCRLFGHNKAISIDWAEPHPMGGFTVKRSHSFCKHCGRVLN